MESTVIRLSKVADILAAPGFDALVAEYIEECATYGVTPTPQWNHYHALEAAGVLHVIGAFKGERLVGFLALLVNRVPHYPAPIGVSESFFVSKDAPGAGLKLRREAENIARSLGAQGMCISVPIGGRAERFMVASRGYASIHRVFFKGFE